MAEAVTPEEMINACVAAWPSPWAKDGGCDEVWSFVGRNGITTWCPTTRVRGGPGTALFFAEYADRHSDALGCAFRSGDAWLVVGRVGDRYLGIVYDEVGGLCERRRIDPSDPTLAENDRLLRFNYLAGEMPDDGFVEDSRQPIEHSVLDAVHRLAGGDGGSSERVRQRQAAQALLWHLADHKRVTAAVACWLHWMAVDAGLRCGPFR